VARRGAWPSSAHGHISAAGCTEIKRVGAYLCVPDLSRDAPPHGFAVMGAIPPAPVAVRSVPRGTLW